MKKKITLLIICLSSIFILSQGFSNKGKEFYISLPQHYQNTNAIFALYLTSDVNTTATIEYNGTTQSLIIVANQVNVFNFGSTGGVDALSAPNYMGATDDAVVSNRAVRVTSLEPIVIFYEIVNSNMTGSTMLFPTSAIGNDYIIPSYSSLDFSNNNGNNGNGIINIIATKANTQIEITPTAPNYANTKTAGTPFTITMPNVGDIYQYRSVGGADLSGTKIKGIGTNASCNNFIVLSASNRTVMGCVGAGSGDNLLSQVFPTTTWGKEFYLAPFLESNGSNYQNSYIRIFKKNANTSVSINKNGTTTNQPITTDFIEISDEGVPIQIIANEPVMVVHYMISQACNSGQGDPEMIIINPVEQALNNITFYSADKIRVPNSNSNIQSHFLNVIIKTTQAASLRIDGVVPTASFFPILGTNYSFLAENITTSTISNSGVHNIKADDNFIAIAYGLGSVESYGYVTGSDFKNKFSNISSTDTTVSEYSNYCVNAIINLSLDIAFIPLQITWDIGNGTTPIVQVNPTPTSSQIIDGVTVYHFLPPSSIAQISYSAVGTYTVKAICSTIVVCDNSNTVTINKVLTINNPTVDILPDVEVCSSYTLPVLTSGNYFTLPNGGGTSKNAGDVITASQTMYVYKKPGSNPNCFAEDSFVITIKPKPTVVASQDETICEGTSKTLSVTGANTYVWSPATGLSATTGNSVTASPTTTTTYTVVGTATNGCTSQDEIIVTVNPNPTVNAGTDIEICEGKSTTLTATGASTYTWSPALGLNTTTGASVIASPTLTTTYTVTATNTNGCFTTDQVMVTVNPNPIISVSGNTNICNGSSTTLVATGAETYTWSPAIGLSATSGATVIATPTTTTTYRITGIDAKGCESFKDITITLNTNPTPSISSSDTDGQICAGENLTLTSNYTTGNVWSTGATTQSITVNSSGSYWVKVTENTCEVQSSNYIVTVNPKPILAVIVDEPACDINEDNFYNKNLTELNDKVVANSSQYTFSYYTNAADATSGTSPLTSINNYNLGNLPKTIWIRVQNTTTPCFEITTATFKAGNVFFIQNNTATLQSCDGVGDIFDGKTTFNLSQFENFFTNDNSVSYSYYETENGATLGDATDRIYTPTSYTNTTAFNQTIYVRIDKNGYCPKMAKINLKVFKTPFSDLLPTKISICENDSKLLDAGAGFASYEWNTSPKQYTQSIIVTKPNTYKVKLTNSDGCSYEQSVEVSQTNIPIISSIISGEDYFEILATGGTPPYEFSIDNGITWQSSNRFSNLKPGEYIIRVRVTSDTGNCEGLSSSSAILSIPNTITPDGDGVNDTWLFRYFYIYPNAKMQLFDRYGKLLIESTKLSNFEWNSKYIQRQLPTGTYWYIIDLDGKTQRNGWLLIKNRN